MDGHRKVEVAVEREVKNELREWKGAARIESVSRHSVFTRFKISLTSAPPERLSLMSVMTVAKEFSSECVSRLF